MEPKQRIVKFEQARLYNAKKNDIITLMPYELIGNVITALLLKVTKPRRISNDDTVKFFHAWCSNCHDKKNNGQIDHIGTMQMMQNVGHALVLSGSGESDTGCRVCGDQSLIFVFHSLTASEQNELMNDSILSIAKQYDALKGIKTEGNTSIDVNAPKSGGNTGCFIATATYNDFNHPNVIQLRQFRDDILLHQWLGRVFIKAYYAISPTIATIIKNNEGLKKVSLALLNRIVKMIA